MKPFIKWPGGKSSEIQYIENLIPAYERYVEPFFGGGAVFFHLEPSKAAINDISELLTGFYSLIQKQSKELRELLLCYDKSFHHLMYVCDSQYDKILPLYHAARSSDKKTTETVVNQFVESIQDELIRGFDCSLILDYKEFCNQLTKMATDKILRTQKNNEKAPFSEEDLKANLITGFASGYYMYFRKVFNDLSLMKIKAPSFEYQIANFYFIREYCYGAMFRYNKEGEFNIPYGGVSYNKKTLSGKIELMFGKTATEIFQNTAIHNQDFETFLDEIHLQEDDFMFLDPPYDTDFSDYEGRAFDANDQRRLAQYLKKTPARFILVIKNTDFIYSLYQNDFNILTFENQYAYNMRSRNERSVEHLIITNFTT